MSSIKNTETILLSYRGQEYTIALANIPVISLSAQSLFRDLGEQTIPPEVFQCHQGAHSLVSIIKELSAAKKSLKRDKQTALFKALLYTALLVAGIWGACTQGYLGISMAIGAFLICFGVTMHLLAPIEIEAVLFMPFVPFILIAKTWTKISNLENRVLHTREIAERTLSVTSDFFQKDHTQLKAELRQKIHNRNLALDELKKLSIEEGRQEITQKAKDYEMALKFIEQGEEHLRDFFR